MLKWEELPQKMRNRAVRPYYDLLRCKQFSLLVKRCFDLVASGILIIFLSPVMLVLAFWIKLDSNGPVFYRQERVTQYGKIFRIFKFRTMVVDADKKGSLVTTKGDSRITRVGNKIRHCRLDEIPQLFNIFLGDMSFVGTRPEVRKYVEAYSDEMLATLLLPAGVTSIASLEFKDEANYLESSDNVDATYIHTILPQKMYYNLQALQRFSCLNEIQTMVRTIRALCR